MDQSQPGSLKDEKKPAMGRAGGRVFQSEELHGGEAPGSLREGPREDRRLECGEQTGQTGQAGGRARAHGEAGPRGSGRALLTRLKFSPGDREKP